MNPASIVRSVLLLALAGCAGVSMAPRQAPAPARPAPAPAALSAQAQALLHEAQTLGQRVAAGELSRVQAAQQLDRSRLRLVGRNEIDDDLYRLYLHTAQQRDAGTLDATAAQQRMDERLRYWLRRWPAQANKPANPAFAQFLLKLFQLPALP